MAGVAGQGWRWVPFAAALTVLVLAPAPAHPADAPGPDAGLNTVLFASLDGMRPGYASVGFKRTLEGPLDRSGPVAMLSAGYGREPISDAPGHRHKAAASALLGYQWVLPALTVAGFVGPEIEYERETVPVGASRRPVGGVRAQAELWAHPLPRTLFTTTVIAGSARGHLWSRVSAGYAVWGRVFVGPEASHYRTDDYREWRLGAHVTGFSWGRLNLRLSAGVSHREERLGGYAGLTGDIRL